MAKRLLQQSATSPSIRPRLGLVCQTSTSECRFRIITRSRFLSLTQAEQEKELTELYWDNLRRLHWTLTYCHAHGIAMYRAPSDLFPMSDDVVGRAVLDSIAASLGSIGRRAERLGIRIVLHPDQFVVLNSESSTVVQNSIEILSKQARWFDLLGLPRSSWAAINIHGGKIGRGKEIVEVIHSLPENIRSRLTLENDERAYGATDILGLCRQAGVPMMFDPHHHVVKEKLETYNDPSIAHFTQVAATTWPHPAWQIVHLSNGLESFCDPRHSHLISTVPDAFKAVPWIEVEAKGKELAIEKLRLDHPYLQ